MVEEVEKKIPTLHSLVSTSFPRNRKVKNPLNKEALIVSTFLNPWMPISNFTFRNNTILVLGGCKTEEMDCFNKLGLSSHPNTLRNMQKKAAISFDKVVVGWKDETVACARKILLLEEVLNRHLEENDQDENAMEVCTIDFSTEAVSNCTHFTESVYESCKEILPQNTVDLVEDTDIVSALNMLKGENSQKLR